ncbi:SUMF1/EgtB/PvdO family nonheme iron enzyme [Flammeovirga yaeyamensis]|uniref:SUMF1/EgtB/PvdO family nonheme iron enzyme n=1 Tax=Flammeovirga yaeyamensis TaxID=367791 RepID=A0AAX1N3P4_9BACT|nr:SUMF1/EgtB/PvdO family nonheme iron enzyme [Flammeovirga yaeyamensis]MBB3700631.1 formylglycine-generating enzyme required for sulfatase activity [Flammeovirga yaeyamensis]NMF37747.1 SUMF1/EgtB/PvdO family nonheme iron enzyme [Flammeovirga yaeyamensis]QWG02055.1 SUMF1/EgtB/PvdO family nonheme iron enzyme [Flammeovirga yaeyamensis]
MNLILNDYLKLFVLAIFLCIPVSTILGNNVRITTLNYGDKDLNDQSIQVNLTLEWDNSWKVTTGPSNHDAVWLFAKFRDTNGMWQHVLFNYDISMDHGHSEINDLATIDLSNDDGFGNAHGVYIHSKDPIAQQSVSYELSLKWNYGQNGLGNDDDLSIRFFAIEMVYVPEAAFELGSSGTENGHLYEYNGSTVTDTYTVNSETEITIGELPGNLWYDIKDSTASYKQGDQLGPIPNDFPKGYEAFYCMKYEISQGLFAGFLSTINKEYADELLKKKTSQRNNITSADDSIYTAAEPYAPLQFLSWKGLAAFLDWSALRPMTELEFEKACRGTATPVAFEYAWGNNDVATSVYTYSNEGTNTEVVATNYSTTLGNAMYNKTNNTQPYRIGKMSSFNLGSTMTRVQSGSTFYGIMEMSGNMEERIVSIGRPEGRSYTGMHGDGQLSEDGLANVTNWPSNSTSIGTGVKGGTYSKGNGRMRISNRISASQTYNSEKKQIGGRGVRTAPTN